LIPRAAREAVELPLELLRAFLRLEGAAEAAQLVVGEVQLERLGRLLHRLERTVVPAITQIANARDNLARL
jgi:hypothetical protein